MNQEPWESSEPYRAPRIVALTVCPALTHCCSYAASQHEGSTTRLSITELYAALHDPERRREIVRIYGTEAAAESAHQLGDTHERRAEAVFNSW